MPNKNIYITLQRSRQHNYFFIALMLITAFCNLCFGENMKNPADSTATAKISKNSIKTKVQYNAKDSISIDNKNQKAYLYGKAEVNYEDVHLTAGYIEIDFKNNVVFAEGVKDSTGKKVENPVFSSAENSFPSKKISYNFKTKKGKIYEVITKEGEGYIHGESVKKDSSNVFYIRHGKYTTCDLEDPHFSINAGKLKVIPNDKIVSGPAYLAIAGIPTPLAVPFGYFPNKKGQASGIIIPTYGESPNLGFFLRDGGYYFGFSDYVDVALKGDIYSYGSWGLKTLSNYRKRYKYNGNFNLSYSDFTTGSRELPNSTSRKDFFVRWSHSQDPKSRPNSRFSANVNAGSSKYNALNSYRAGDYLSNTFQSNISYSKTFAGTPFNLSANARHSQNTITRKIDLNIPELTLNMTRIQPFKNKNRIETKWYDKIGVSWVTNAQNVISTYDSLLFKPNTLEQMRNGISHSLPVSASFNILKHFVFTPTISTSSKWYFQTIEKRFDKTADAIVTDTIQGFKMANEVNASANISTRVYGMYVFKNSPLKAIRHVITPSVSASYRPDFSQSKFGYYKTVQADTLGNTQQYSIFQNGIYGSPAAGKSGIISMSLNNNLEMKVRGKKDTADRKVTLIEGLAVSTAYNLSVEKFNWQNINVTGRTKLFNALDINLSGSFDPYSIDSAGVRIEKFELNENGRLGRLTSANAAIGINLNNERKDKKKESDKGTQEEIDYINAHPEEFVDFSVPWNLGVYYNINYSKFSLVEDIVQTLNFRGDLKITKKWKVGFISGYDFINNDFSYTSLNVYRDLHCWEMSFNWIPFGFRQSYSININVKSSVLQDLKLSRRRDWYDF